MSSHWPSIPPSKEGNSNIADSYLSKAYCNHQCTFLHPRHLRLCHLSPCAPSEPHQLPDASWFNPFQTCFSVQTQQNPNILIFWSGYLRSLNPFQSSTKPSSNQLSTSHRLRHCRGNCLFHFYPQRAAPNWYQQRHCAWEDGEFIMADGDFMVIQWWFNGNWWGS